MRIEEVFSGGSTYAVSRVVNGIATRLGNLYDNLRKAAQESGIDVSAIDNPGKLAQLYASEGPKAIAELLGAVVLAKVLVVRELGRYAGGNSFTEVLNEEFKDFPGAPSLADIDSFLQSIEGGTTTTTEAHRLVEITAEESEESEEGESEEEEGGE